MVEKSESGGKVAGCAGQQQNAASGQLNNNGATGSSVICPMSGIPLAMLASGHTTRACKHSLAFVVL